MTLSGAHVVKLPFVVVKYGDSSIGEQAVLMRTLPHSARIYAASKNWYVMERLRHSPDWPWITTLDFLQDIWKLPTSYGLQWESKLRELLTVRQSPLLEYLTGPCRELDGTTPCMTHGDPTWEHVMTDGKHFKLIDPIRRPYLPPHPVTDLAKMYQSLLGWELIRYKWKLPRYIKSIIEDDILKVHETRNMWFWTALCFQRIAWRRPESHLGSWAKFVMLELIDRKDIP